MTKQLLTFLLALILTPAIMFAQQTKTVKGTIVDKDNQPVIGATVKVNGTNIVTATDFDGKYELSNVPENATISYTYIGMAPQQMKVAGKSTINIQMIDDSQNLEEVVVIGYGSAKAKDLTSPIAVVKGDDIAAIATTSPMTALQGMIPGLTVTKSNAPGATPQVKIRGIGSFGTASPLYVVDGMFYDNIDFLNNADIQEMSVLKDASAAAIYGVRAANGVIIVTTKKGSKNQKPRVTYDGYVGVQKATNVLKMANSYEYATMMMEADYDTYSSYMINSIDLFGGSHADADFHNWTYGADTDWYDELLRTAVQTNHSLNIQGGSDKATYAIGMNYLYQDGIMDCENNYQRLNFRANLDYEAYKWLKVGGSMVVSNATQHAPDNYAWQLAFNMPGIIPVYSDLNTEAFPEHYASPSQVGFTGNFNNPVARANISNSLNETFRVNPTFYAELNFLDGKIKAKTQYSQSFQFTNSRVFTDAYYVSSWQQSSQSSLSKSDSKYRNYVWDNTITYHDVFGKHSLTAMVGQSSREENYRYLAGTATNVPNDREEYWYLTNGNVEGRTVTDNGTTYRGLSFFGRINYDFDGKYLLNVTVREDGSSKYNDKWGFFPSVGAAWVISNENFWDGVKGIDYMKIRASWGKLGNDNVAASDGYAGISTGSNFYNGIFGGNSVTGYYYDGEFSWLKWEQVEEWNAGLNFTTLKNRLAIDLDYYNRTTKNAIIHTTLPLSNTTIAGNNGEICNQGFELTANWVDQVGDFKYSIGANLAYLHNEVKSLNGAPYIYGGSAENRTIALVGEEMNSYYGWKVDGIYQNAEQIANDPVAQNIIKSGIDLEPGDFKYKDINNDGMVDDNDRVCLGSNIPTISYGLNLGLQWKNIDFSIAMAGVAGNEIYNRKRGLRYAQPNYNFDKDIVVNRWHGEGTSNSYPSAKALTKGWNKNHTSDFYVEDGSYFRIQNVQLGYSFRDIKMGSYTMPCIRLSLAAENPLCAFKANSFTPEVTSNIGWDTEVYPQYATYTFGVSIDF